MWLPQERQFLSVMGSKSFKAQPGKQKISDICKGDGLIDIRIGYTNLFGSCKSKKDAELF